jgi:hypothetical protein
VSSEAATWGRIGGLTKASRATPDDKAAQRDVLRRALTGKYEAEAREAFHAKGYDATEREVAEAGELLRRAAQLRAAMAGGRARRERARNKRVERGGR